MDVEGISPADVATVERMVQQLALLQSQTALIQRDLHELFSRNPALKQHHDAAQAHQAITCAPQALTRNPSPAPKAKKCAQRKATLATTTSREVSPAPQATKRSPRQARQATPDPPAPQAIKCDQRQAPQAPANREKHKTASAHTEALRAIARSQAGSTKPRPDYPESPCAGDPEMDIVRSRSPSPTSDCTLQSDGESRTASSQSSSDSEFTLVQGKRKRSSKKVRPSQAPPAKLPAGVWAAPEPSPASSHPPPTPAASAPGKKERPPPPIFLRQKEKWDKVCSVCRTRNIAFTHARSTRDGIKITVSTSTDHRRLTSFLREEGIGFHTYALEDERVLRVVIRGIPAEQDIESVKKDLLAQNFPVRAVHRIISSRLKKACNLVLVILDPTPEGKAIFDVKSVNQLKGLHVETPNRKGTPSQCHRCQIYGHSARNCYSRPRCVKCLGDHGTADCARTKSTVEPPSCVLCGTIGHTANYRGCPAAPRANNKTVRSAPPRVPQTTPQYTKATPKVTTVPQATPHNAWDKPLKSTSLGRQAPHSSPPLRPQAAYRPPHLRAAPSGPPPAQSSPSLSTEDLIAFGEKVRAIKDPILKLMFITDNKALYRALTSPSSPFN